MTPPPAEKVAEPFTGPFACHDLPGTIAENGKNLQFVADANGTPITPRWQPWIAQWIAARLNASAPAPSVAQSEREAFEAWFARSRGRTVEMCRSWFHGHTDGGYILFVRDQWEGWQARASAGSARVDAREAIAEIIYDAMRFERFSETEGWIKNGNSLAQDRARRASGRILAAHTHSAPPALTEEERRQIVVIKERTRAYPGHSSVAGELLAIIERLTASAQS